MKSYKKSSCHKLYLIGPTLYEKMLPLLNDVEKQEIIESKRFPCGGCKKAFTSIFSLKRHFTTFHMLESAKKYSCQACDKSYTQSHNLKIHIQKFHEGLKLPRSSAGIKNEFQITNSKKKIEFTPDEVDRVTPNVENETLKKPKYTRGPYRKKSMPQGKVFKQIDLEALLGALNSELGL